MNGVLEKAKTTTSLIKLNILNRNTQKVTAEVSFGLKIHFKDLKKKKFIVSEVHLFLQEVKQFLATWCNHLARCCRSLNPVHRAEHPETYNKLFDKILEKLVICKNVTLTSSEATKNEYFTFLQILVKKNLPAFRGYQIYESRLD